MAIADALGPDRVVFLTKETRFGALNEMVTLLSEVPGMPCLQEMEKEFIQREEMMSTGIGMGLGVPHVRMAGIQKLVMAVGIHKQGLSDYPAIDSKPVHIIAMIAAGEGQHAEYIRMLAKVVAVLKQETARNAILAAGSPQEAYDILCAGS